MSPTRRTRSTGALGATTLLTATLLSAGCSDHAAPSGAPVTSPARSSAPAAPDEGKEVRRLAPRVVIAHDADGLVTLDAESGATVHEQAQPGFLRLANAGDGRHVMVVDSDVFRVYDAGIQSQAHGDHAHRYTYTPGMTDVTYEAKKAGHVVLHHGWTTLFADGTGEMQVVDSAAVAQPGADVARTRTPEAHHGVAFRLANGAMIRTEGNKDGRKTVLVEKDGATVARTDDCKGVHGEAPAQPNAQGDVAVFGCETGPVVYRDGAFHKVKVTEAYARTGNLAGSESSPIVLSDYKVVKGLKEGDEPEHPTRVGLIDSRADRIDLVDLGGRSYWFRSLARGPKGEAIVLTTDGALTVIDVRTKKVVRSVPAIAPWKEKKDWQEPGPAVKVAEDRAYVTDAANKQLVVVDLTTWKVVRRIPLAHTPVEMVVVTGRAEAPVARD